MPLTPGTRLGPYEVVALLGVGGMGEVYRARDTRLNRDVALKILPKLFSADPDRLARFTREARTLASLNHPHIAHLHGLEESAGAPALVMELVEGEDLAHRLARGAVPIDEALSIARQVADALEAAHERGIVHRDLKPANIKIRADGTAKVLDFGLAKAMSPSLTGDGAGTGEAGGDDPIADSPTMTSPALTQSGIILGTAAYMSPEQARGKPVDKRTDIWAFGCVLFEMLSGRRPFDSGDTVSDAIAAILKTEPAWAALPSDIPAHVRTLLGRCLEKDPRRRLRDIGDAALYNTEGLGSTAGAPIVTPVALRSRRLTRWTAAAGWIAAAVLLATLIVFRFSPARSNTVSPKPMRLTVPLATSFVGAQSPLTPSFALSPDGTRLVYAGRQGDSSALYFQDLTTGEVKRLPETTDADAPFFSPDGEAIGFHIRGSLRTTQLTGGLIRELGAAENMRSRPFWTESNGIVFATPAGLSRMSPDGGSPVPIATLGPDDGMFTNPAPLPGGDAFLAAVRSKRFVATDDQSQIGVLSLRTGDRKIIVEHGSSPSFVSARGASAGYVVYGLGNRLMAVPFDAKLLTVTGRAVPVIENVEMRPNGDAAQFAISRDGAIVYRESSQAELVWVDRGGIARPLSSALRRFAMPRLSPDGRLLAVEIQETPHQIWLLDLERDVLVPLTSGADANHNFAWAPDSRSVIVTASRGTTSRLSWMRIDGSGEAATILEKPDLGPWVESWSRDGRWLTISLKGPSMSKVAVLSLDQGSPPKLTDTVNPIADDACSSNLSPDNQWLAYFSCDASDKTAQVFIRRSSDGARYQVSTEGSTEPLWGRSGRELFFRSGTKMMAVDVAVAPEVRIGRPRVLFDGDYLAWGSGDFDVSADGQRFVMVRPANTGMTGKTLTVRLNWLEELKRVVPAQ